MSDVKIQWHPGFVAAMDLEFAENRADLIYEKEQCHLLKMFITITFYQI